jgi:hypothetical protein
MDILLSPTAYLRLLIPFGTTLVSHNLLISNLESISSICIVCIDVHDVKKRSVHFIVLTTSRLQFSLESIFLQAYNCATSTKELAKELEHCFIIQFH